MKKEQLNFLKELIAAPSPSGYEWPAAKIYREYVNDYADSVETDVMGSVTAIKNPNGSPKIMLAAHIDEIGMIVTYIDEQGYVYFNQIGGIDPGVLPGLRVVINNEKGPVLGVIGRVAVHMMEKEEIGKGAKLTDLWIDLGVSNKEEAEKIIKVGDPITVKYTMEELAGKKVVSRGFDDKAGVFVIAEVLRLLKGKNIKPALYATATTQEELGLRGVRTSAYRINPDVGIAVDVTHGIDHPGASKTKFGSMELGKGPVLHRGGNITPKVEKLLFETAEANKIPHQIEANGNGTGTDAFMMQLTRTGTATGLVSIPLRYMHTPSEVCNLDDLENSAKLIAGFIEKIDNSIDWTP